MTSARISVIFVGRGHWQIVLVDFGAILTEYCLMHVNTVSLTLTRPQNLESIRHFFLVAFCTRSAPSRIINNRQGDRHAAELFRQRLQKEVAFP